MLPPCAGCPVLIRTEVLVSPRAITSVTPGSPTIASISGAESLAAARMSTSPIVSRKRRSEPACSQRSQPGTALIAATIRAGDVGGHVQRYPLVAGCGPARSRASACPRSSARSRAGPAAAPRRWRADELGDRADPELAVQLEGALGAERRDPRHLPHPVRDRGAQILQRRDRAGLLELDDLRRDRGADAGDLPQRRRVEQPDVAAVAGDRLGRLLVVPRPERVAAGDLRAGPRTPAAARRPSRWPVACRNPAAMPRRAAVS